MRTGIRTWVIVAGVACGLMLAGYSDAASLFGRSKPSKKPPTTSPAKPPAITWAVVEVMNAKGEISYEAIQSQQLKDRIKRLHNDYLKAIEKWKKDKVLANIKKTKFEEKKPVVGYVKRVATTPPSFKYQDLASAEAAELTKQMQEGKNKKAETSNSAQTTPKESKTTEEPKANTPPTGQVLSPPASEDNGIPPDNQAP